MAEKEENKKHFQFDGTNYNNWKFRMHAVLEAKDLMEYVEEDLEVITLHENDRDYRKHLKNEKRCKSVLIDHIADSQLEHIKDKTTAKEIFDALKSVFERKSVAGQLLLRKQLCTLKFDEIGNMNKHLLEFDNIIRELKGIGAKMEDIDVICQLLLTMPNSYNSLVTSLETLHPETLNMEFVKSRLLDEYRKRNINGILKDSNKNGTSSDSVAMNAFRFQCHNCGKIGHKKWQCPNLNKENNGQNGNWNWNKNSANLSDTRNDRCDL